MDGLDDGGAHVHGSFEAHGAAAQGLTEASPTNPEGVTLSSGAPTTASNAGTDFPPPEVWAGMTLRHRKHWCNAHNKKAAEATGSFGKAV
jgi:hypothetical protein